MSLTGDLALLICEAPIALNVFGSVSLGVVEGRHAGRLPQASPNGAANCGN